jgi:acetyl-CoA synthetase
MSHPRDHFIQDLAEDAKASAKGSDVIEYVDSNDPLFILYTSGSTGTPKGLVHSTAGYLLYAMVTHNTAFDFHAGNTFGCVADIGWITGHSYIMYGPLANGGTTLLFESIPTYPDPGRYWELVERLRLTHFYAAPTALRVLMKHGTKWVFKHDRSSLRVLGSVGEPINKDAWTWYNDVVGEKRCDLVDTWWQTETGGICLSPRPSGPNDPIVPAMAMRPFFGIKPKIIGAEESESESIEGPLCLEKPWPGLALTVWGAPARFKETYFSQYPPYYFTGDGAIRNEKGYWKITGRMDDVINVTGHRIGTAEVEDALARHKYVSESAVVGFPHEIKGEGIFAFVILKNKADLATYQDALIAELRDLCRSHIAAFAVPDYILFCDALPKTRSGKIMRRILRIIATGSCSVADLGDVSTLAEPQVVESLVKARQSLQSSKT